MSLILCRIKIVVILGFFIESFEIFEVIIWVGVNVVWMNFLYGIVEDYKNCV